MLHLRSIVLYTLTASFLLAKFIVVKAFQLITLTAKKINWRRTAFVCWQLLVLCLAIAIAILRHIMGIQKQNKQKQNKSDVSLHLIQLEKNDPLFYIKKGELKKLGYRYNSKLNGWIHPKALL